MPSVLEFSTLPHVQVSVHTDIDVDERYTHLPCKCEVLGQEQRSQGLATFTTATTSGLIPAKGTLDVEVTLQALRLGRIQLPLQVKVRLLLLALACGYTDRHLCWLVTSNVYSYWQEAVTPCTASSAGAHACSCNVFTRLCGVTFSWQCVLQLLGSTGKPMECIIGATAIGPTLNFVTDTGEVHIPEVAFGTIDVLQVRHTLHLLSSTPSITVSAAAMDAKFSLFASSKH